MSKSKKYLKKDAPPSSVTTPSNIPHFLDSLPNKPWWWLVGSMLILAILTRFVYNNALDNQFLDWDDQSYVTENPILIQYGQPQAPQVWNAPVSLNYHPLTIQTLVWNAQNLGKKAETNARPFISTNIWLHALNSGLVFLFIWLLTRGNWLVSFFGGLIFAIHPMHVESVAWVSERKDVLYGFFFLLSLVSYLRYTDSRQYKWLALTLLFFILSCLSKAMAVSLVPVLFLLDWWRNRSFMAVTNWVEKIPFILVALITGGIAINIQQGDNLNGLLYGLEGAKQSLSTTQISLFNRCIFASYGMSEYIFQFFVPNGLSFFYPYPDEALCNLPIPSSYYRGIPILFLLGGLALWSTRYTKSLLFGFGFYVVTVLLVSQILSVGIVIRADRYTYLPYIGLTIGLLMLIEQWTSRNQTLRYGIWGVVGLVCLFWIQQTIKRVDIWQNTDTLLSDGLKQYPNSSHILGLIGAYYGKNGKIQEAKNYLEQAIHQKYPVKNVTVYESLGNAYGTLNNPQKAVEMFSEAINISPIRGSAYYNRAIAYSNFDPQKSIEDIEKGFSLLSPKEQKDALLLKGFCYLQTKEYQKTITTYAPLIANGTANEIVYSRQAIAKFNLGDKKGAIEDFERALKINPNYEEAKRSLAQIGR